LEDRQIGGISEAKNLARFESLQAYYSIAGRDLERELLLCSKPKRLDSWFGVRWPAVCSRQVQSREPEAQERADPSSISDRR